MIQLFKKTKINDFHNNNDVDEDDDDGYCIACKISPSSCPHAAYSLVGKMDTDPQTTISGDERCMWQLSYFSKEPYEMDTLNYTYFSEKQLRLREITFLVQGHPTSKRQNLPWSSGPSSHTLNCETNVGAADGPHHDWSLGSQITQ